MTSQSPKTPLTRKITPLFKKAAVAATLLFMVGPCDSFYSMPLTEGEANLAHSVFGDQIDTSIVRKVFYMNASGTSAASVGNKEIIKFYKPNHHSKDYSKETNLFRYGLFMHETMHILQYQKISTAQFKNCKEYIYTLAKDTSFKDYCAEQQGDIIGDYAVRFLHPSHKPSTSYLSENCELNKDTPESDALLQKVVEDQFPQARKTRLALEAQRSKEKGDTRKLAELRLSLAP